MQDQRTFWTVIGIVLLIALGVWVWFATTAGSEQTATSAPITGVYDISARDSGKTFEYPETSRFTVTLDEGTYPQSELSCTPSGVIGTITNVGEPPAAPLYAARYEAVAPGTCTLADRDFSVTIVVTGTNENATTTDATGTGTGSQGIVKFNSGIRGTVLAGPTCPVVHNPPTQDCADRPYQTDIVISRTTSPTVPFVTTRTNAEGQFEASLPPGDYVVTAAGGRTLPTCTAQTVTVDPAGYATTTISCDTGIR